LTNPTQLCGMRSIALALVLSAASAPAFAVGLNVPLNEATVVEVKSAARDVIVGSPDVADVQVADRHHLVVTGKKIGLTNLIVRDDAGRTVFSQTVVVGASAGGRVSLINGGYVASYACAPTCEPAGDGQSVASSLPPNMQPPPPAPINFVPAPAPVTALPSPTH
jgi:putative type II/III system pilus formation protein